MQRYYKVQVTIRDIKCTVVAPEFFGCRAYSGHRNLDWGTFKKLCVLS